MHITHMQLDKWNPHAQQRIPDRDRRMREGARVDDDAVDLVAGRGVDAVDEGAFVVGLEGLEGGVEGGGVGGAGRLDVGEGGGAVDVWFAGAEEVEVGAVEEEDGFAHFLSFLLFCFGLLVLESDGFAWLCYAMRCDGDSGGIRYSKGKKGQLEYSNTAMEIYINNNINLLDIYLCYYVLVWAFPINSSIELRGKISPTRRGEPFAAGRDRDEVTVALIYLKIRKWRDMPWIVHK